MKCDKLKAYKGDVTIPVYGTIADADVYLKKEADEAIAELKKKLAEKESWVKMLGEGEAALSLELEKTKQKLEDVQASMYADVVDANMENRKLRRALWIARANRAEAEHAHWATIWFCNNKIVLNINKSSVSQDPYKSNTLKYAYEWRNMWFYIASKCRTKAEEYK